MNYWLMKTEPSSWSWSDQATKKITSWDGVRNYQASNNLKAMQIGDLCFFYHSISDKKIMGVVKVIKTYYPDPTDETNRFGMVDVIYEYPLENPISLETIKNNPGLNHLALVKQSRLSVMPIDKPSWDLIHHLSKINPS